LASPLLPRADIMSNKSAPEAWHLPVIQAIEGIGLMLLVLALLHSARPHHPLLEIRHRPRIQLASEGQGSSSRRSRLSVQHRRRRRHARAHRHPRQTRRFRRHPCTRQTRPSSRQQQKAAAEAIPRTVKTNATASAAWLQRTTTWSSPPSHRSHHRQIHGRIWWKQMTQRRTSHKNQLGGCLARGRGIGAAQARTGDGARGGRVVMRLRQRGNRRSSRSPRWRAQCQSKVVITSARRLPFPRLLGRVNLAWKDRLLGEADYREGVGGSRGWGVRLRG